MTLKQRAASRSPGLLRVATFNINDVNRRLPNLLAWLAETRPDVVCLQETKAADAAFPIGALAEAGYQSVLAGERPYNGVAILGVGLHLS